jgi:hypothetical protein
MRVYRQLTKEVIKPYKPLCRNACRIRYAENNTHEKPESYQYVHAPVGEGKSFAATAVVSQLLGK